MTVPEQIPYVGYIGNGTTTIFPITFHLSDPEYLVVTVNKEIPQTGNYTVDATNGNVIFGVAPASGAQVELYRETQLNRDTEYKSYNNSFRPEIVNYDFDKVWQVLQEQHMIDAEVLARIKAEIEWRRTHDANFDELSKMRDSQIFSGLKQYLDTIVAATDPNIFGGITAGIVFALDKKSVQTHLEEIADEFLEVRELISAIEDGSSEAIMAESQRAQQAEGQLSSNIVNETSRALFAENQLEQAIAATAGGYFKSYKTLALANADIANIPLNVSVRVLSDEDGGDYSKPSLESTELEKSPYDPAKQFSNLLESKLTKIFGYLFTVDGFIDDTGALVSTNSYKTTEFIEVAKSMEYSLRSVTDQQRSTIAFYDENKNFIGNAGKNQNVLSEVKYTTPSNCAFIRCTGLVLYGVTNNDFYIKSNLYNIDLIKKILESSHVDLSSKNVIYQSSNVSEALDKVLSNQQQIINDTNAIIDKLDIADDKLQPFFIDTTEFVKSCLTPSNFGTVNVTSRNSDRVLTVSDITAFVVNGACTIFDNVANTYTSHIVKAISGSQVTFFDDVPANPQQIQTMHDATNGQHLNPFGYRGLADYIIDQIQRYSYRKKENLLFDFHPYKHKTIAYDNPSLYDFETGTVKLINVATSNVTFGGFTEGTTNLARFVGTDFQSSGARNNVQLFSIAYQFVQGVQDAAFSINIPTGTKSGFVHIPLSCDIVDYVAVGGGSFKTSGRARIKVFIGTTIIHEQIYDVGMVHHVYVDFENAESLKVEVSLADNKPSVILLHGVYVYSKSTKTSIEKIIPDGSNVGFLGDSWYVYPIATTVGEAGQVRPDGSVSDGAQYLSRRIKDKLASIGVSVNTLNMAKGGQTSEWGKYWIQNMINLNPTHVFISFAINDHNSKDIADGYDFSPTDQWVNLPVASGGINGRVLTTEKWLENINWICDKFVNVGIKPIVILPPQTAAFSRTQGMRMTQLNMIYEGF